MARKSHCWARGMTQSHASALVPTAWHGTPSLAVQVLWNPVFGCMFFGYMGAVDGMGPSAIGDKIQNNLWTSVSLP